ncbi:DNA binding transcription factor [Phytophthora megakarya]|uniref:DNA binding transcription factor n=1 Tax=Phytophthora megakarya TaxID=4795 RepID=A0A225WUY6_9STRA|nr:DNA binding transcription factor [Phytophthora megakarya]
MTNPLPSVHTIAPPMAAFPSLPDMTRYKNSLAASYASYVVRVHTRHGIKTLSFDVLAELFTFTAKKAAEDLGISSRTLIRVCRSLGIRRWPYLGFRSEKNVERIRQEAMENLRRKLEKEGEALPTPVLHPNAPSLRGASAKRLLLVKMPQLALPSLQETPSKMSAVRAGSWCSSPTLSNATTTFSVSDDDERMSESDETDFTANIPLPSFPPPYTPAAPLMTPPPTGHGFNLDLQRVSPSKAASVAYPNMNLCLKRNSWTATTISTQTAPANRPTTSPVPSLNLLVDASILSSFKNDTPSLTQESSLHQPQQLYTQPRTMSMQDILTLHH